METVTWDDVQSYITKMNARGEGIYLASVLAIKGRRKDTDIIVEFGLPPEKRKLISCSLDLLGL